MALTNQDRLHYESLNALVNIAAAELVHNKPARIEEDDPFRDVPVIVLNYLGKKGIIELQDQSYILTDKGREMYSNLTDLFYDELHK